MISNNEILKDAYICKEKIMRYLVYEKHIPISSYDKNGNYYFIKTPQLIEALDNMPLKMKIYELFSK